MLSLCNKGSCLLGYDFFLLFALILVTKGLTTFFGESQHLSSVDKGLEGRGRRGGGNLNLLESKDCNSQCKLHTLRKGTKTKYI